MSAALGMQVPLLIVQRYTYVPYAVTVAVDVPLVGEPKTVVPGPDTWLHNPVPGDAGVFPPSAPLVSVPQ